MAAQIAESRPNLRNHGEYSDSMISLAVTPTGGEQAGSTTLPDDSHGAVALHRPTRRAPASQAEPSKSAHACSAAPLAVLHRPRPANPVTLGTACDRFDRNLKDCDGSSRFNACHGAQRSPQFGRWGPLSAQEIEPSPPPPAGEELASPHRLTQGFRHVKLGNIVL